MGKKNYLGGKPAQQVKALALSSFTTRVRSPESTWWRKERDKGFQPTMACLHVNMNPTPYSAIN